MNELVQEYFYCRQ